jgi:hypothetical protein
MMLALCIDPAELRLPRERIDIWLQRVADLGDLVAEDAIVGSTPLAAKHALLADLADWDAVSEMLDNARVGIRPDELFRIIDPLTGRLAATPLQHGEAALSDITLSPSYRRPPSNGEVAQRWEEHLALLALERTLRGRPIAVLSGEKLWDTPCDRIEIEGTLDLLLDGNGDLDEQMSEGERVREFAKRLSCVNDLFTHLASEPCLLIEYPRFGASVIWRERLGCQQSLAPFEIGPGLLASIRMMNYLHEPRRATACLRAMALIAGGQRDVLSGHAERDGAGAGNATLRDPEGHLVHRTYLAQNSPNAHRLFWVNAQPPRFLNVGGHDSRPAL